MLGMIKRDDGFFAFFLLRFFLSFFLPSYQRTAPLLAHETGIVRFCSKPTILLGGYFGGLCRILQAELQPCSPKTTFANSSPSTELAPAWCGSHIEADLEADLE